MIFISLLSLLLLLFPFTRGFSMEKKQFIINSKVPICKNCVYFKPYKYDEKFYDLGKCTKFGKIDIVSGIIEYKYACNCRTSDNLCSFNGTYYEERKHPNITLSIFQSEFLNE
jgi:hypothetical protein